MAIVEVLIPGLPGPPGPAMQIAGPALAGRISGTGGLERIGLGAGLEIINGALSVTGGVGGYSALSMPTGFAVTGSGTASIAVTFASGYRLLTTAEAASWNTAASLAASAIQPGNAALADAREWTAPTATQAEAEAGSSTSRLAFTPQRIFQAVAAWWAASASTVGKALATSVDAAAGRATLGAAAVGPIGSSGLTMTTARLLGRSTAGTGAPEEVSIGSGLSLSGGILTATTGGGGTVTSVGLSVPTGLSVSGSPVTASGTLALAFAAGYSLPTTASQAQWNTAYSERNQWDGGATGLVAATGRASLGLGSAALSAAADFAAASHTQAASTITGLATVATSGAYADLSGRPSLGTAAPLDVAVSGDASAIQVVRGSDSRLSDAREWSAPTATQAEAETGTSTTRLAFTPQRIFQAVAAWWMATSSAVGRALVTAADQAAGRAALGLGSASTGALATTAPSNPAATAAAGDSGDVARANHAHQFQAETAVIPLSMPAGSVTVGELESFECPETIVLTAIPRWCVKSAPAGAALQFDIRVGGTSIFSTLPTIAIGGISSSATTPAVFAAAFVSGGQQIAAGAVVTIHCTQQATSGGTGGKVSIYNRRAN